MRIIVIVAKRSEIQNIAKELDVSGSFETSFRTLVLI